MASKKFSEFASALDFLDTWFVVGYDPAEGNLVDANKRVTWENATSDLAKAADLAAHTGDSAIHVTAAQSAALDASQSPSGANPYLTDSAGDAAYDAIGSAAAVQANLDAHEAAASPHSGHLITVNAGTNVTIDKTDPQRPVISASGGGGGITNPLTEDLDVGNNFRIISGATPNANIELNADGSGVVRVMDTDLELRSTNQSTGAVELLLNGGTSGNNRITAQGFLLINGVQQLQLQAGGANNLIVNPTNVQLRNDLRVDLDDTRDIFQDVIRPKIIRTYDLDAKRSVTVPDEAYGVGWNGSFEVPTKNAVYDKIETLGGGIIEQIVFSATLTAHKTMLADNAFHPIDNFYDEEIDPNNRWNPATAQLDLSMYTSGSVQFYIAQRADMVAPDADGSVVIRISVAGGGQTDFVLPLARLSGKHVEINSNAKRALSATGADNVFTFNYRLLNHPDGQLMAYTGSSDILVEVLP